MNSVEETMSQFCPFGYLDIKAACEFGDQVGLNEGEIFEIVDEFRESCGLDGYGNIDPVYCVMDHVLQQARNLIDDQIDYDFVNDFSGLGSEIYTYGNFMCSSYDYSAEAVEELGNHLNNISQQVKDILIADDMCRYFLSELDIKTQKRE